MSTVEEKEAKHGEKMIEVKIRFWTNKIAEGKDKIKPKNAWTAGVVRMRRNDLHGIKPGSPLPFGSLMHLGAVVEKCLIKHSITLHTQGKVLHKMPQSKKK